MLKLNIGHNRKVGEPNYGSRGASCNLELEVESTMIEQPAELRKRVRWLFVQAREAVEEELNGGQNGVARSAIGQEHPESPAPPADDEQPAVRPATASQVRAIYAISGRNRADLPTILSQRYQVAKPDDLSIGDASRLIDELKAQNGAGVAR